MPSRKRAKGKERKANKSVASHCNWAALAIGGGKNREIGCNHCLSFVPPRQHPAALLVDNIITALSVQRKCHESLQLSFKTKPQLWSNSNNRKLATSVLKSIGVNLILCGNDIEMATVMANAVLLLSNYDGKGDFSTSLYASAPEAQLLNGGLERDVVRYFIRHTTCSCLKKKYRQLRWQQKVGQCNNCLKTVIRSDLMMCGGCRTTLFCSRECQS